MLRNEYFNIDDLWCDTIEHLLMRGRPLDSRAGKCLEITGYTATLTNVNATLLLNTRRKLSPHYACAELLWYLDRDPSIAMISAYAPQYVNFAEDGRAFGAYGYRNYANLWGRDGDVPADVPQLHLIVDHLRQDPNTRQAVMTFWEANDLAHAIKKDHKDLPCTLALQFLLRDDRLHLVATMRSNDAWLGLLYDVFAFTGLQWLVATALGVEPGTYTHQAGSEHLYERNWTAATEALKCRELTPGLRRLQHEWRWDVLRDYPDARLRDLIYRAREAEHFARIGDVCGARIMLESLKTAFGANNVLCDAAAVCADKWSVDVRPTSPILLSSMDFKGDPDADHRGK